PAPARVRPANRCVTLTGPGGRSVSASANGYRLGGAAIAFYAKPTGLGTYLLYDAGARLMTASGNSQVTRGTAPAPPAEWALAPRTGGRFALRSTATGEAVAVRPSD